MRLGVNGRFYGARTTGVQRFAREVTARLAALEEVVLFIPSDVPAAGLPPEARVVRGRLRGQAWEQVELPLAAWGRDLDLVLHPANAAPRFGPPGVVVLHDLTPLSHPSAYRSLYRTWVRLAHAAPAKRAHRVITVSDWSAGEIGRFLGIPAERISVVLQGAGPLDSPASPEAVADVRLRYGLPRPFFLAVGGGDPKKGGAFLRRVWRQVGSAAADLVAVGGTFGAVHTTGSETGAPLPLHGHVPDDDLRALYTGSVALLFPSEAEGFGRPPLEALACGTRVVAAPYGPVAQVLGNAADVIPLDESLWVGRVRALLDEPPQTRRARIEEGRRHAAGFSWDRAAARVARVCRDVVEGLP
jgi:glycosyltransferase involved in cell wall biosynthesis